MEGDQAPLANGDDGAKMITSVDQEPSAAALPANGSAEPSQIQEGSEEPPAKKIKLEDQFSDAVNVETAAVAFPAPAPAAAATEEPAPVPLPPQGEDDDEDDDEDLFGGADDEEQDADKESTTPTGAPAPVVPATEIQAETPAAVVAAPEAVVEKKSEDPPAVLAPEAEVVKTEAILPLNDTMAETQTIPQVPPPAALDPHATASALAEATSAPTQQPKEVSIPRKSPRSTKKTSAPASPMAPMAPIASPDTDGRVPGTRFGLPYGVFVPSSIVKSRLLDSEMNTPGSKLMDVLKSLPVNLINDALTEYDDAVEIKGASAIRNHGAYLYGVVKRYVQVHERAMSGEGTGILPMGEEGLTPVVQSRLDHLVSSGFCTTQEMNEKVKSKIRMLSEKDALFALDELASVDRSSIRNFGSYFMGILNRYMRGDVTSKARPNQQQQIDRSNLSRDRFNRDNSKNLSSSYRPQIDRRSSNDFGSTGAYRNENRGNNQMFDNRQPPWQQQQRPMGGGYPAMGGGPTHQQGPPPNMNQSMQGPPSNAGFAPQQQYMPQQQPQQQPPYMQQQPFVQQSSGYPPNPQQSGMPDSSGMYHQPQNNMMGGPPQPYGNNIGNPPMPQYMQQQQPQGMNQYQQPLPYGQGSSGAGPSMQQGSWQQPPPSVPVDIMGLADKAASVIQALGSSQSSNFNAMASQSFPPQQYQQQPPQQAYSQYGSGGSMAQPLNMMQQQPFAAQQYQPQSQQPSGAPTSLNRPAQMVPSQGRRRTTAAITELPMTVQYAVQNIVATGGLDGYPDEGIVGMIFDLPEDLALASLQKFASLDKSTMRNKTAYLAGVLRRELEKINRR